MKTTKRRRGQRGLVDAELVDTALREIERGGLDGFGLRCAARAIGCDVATLSYRFGSKEGLNRAIAERLHAGIKPPPPHLAWNQRLANIARQYRLVAQTYPQAFPLLMRFWTSGPCDLIIAEHWHAALADGGVPERQIPQVGCATYAAILGLCASEVSGLLGVPTAETLAEVESLDELKLTRRLLPVFETLGAETVFETALSLLLAGLQGMYAAPSRSRPRPAQPRNRPAAAKARGSSSAKTSRS
jgi:AcrR family transcriptional regulator